MLLGCGGSGVLGQQHPLIRVFNGVDNQSALSVSYADANGNKLATSLTAPFGGTTASDVEIPNTIATPTVQAGGAALFTGRASLYRVNTQYSLYTGGVPGNYVAISLNDVGAQGNTAGSMNVRGVHVGANTPAIDVYIVPASPGGVSGTALFSSLTFGQVTAASNSTVAVDGNGYALLAVTAGTLYEAIVTAHNSKTPLATTTSLLRPQVFYSVVVYDSGTGVAVKILSDRH